MPNETQEKCARTLRCLFMRSFPSEILELGLADVCSHKLTGLSRLGVKELLLLLFFGAGGRALVRRLF